MALLVLGAIGVGVGLVLAMGAAVQRIAFEDARNAAKVAAVHLGRELEARAETVTALVERLGGSPVPADRAERLRAWLSLHQSSFFVGLALANESGGDWLEIHRPKAVAELAREGAELADAARRRRGTLARLVAHKKGGQPLLVLASAGSLEGGAGGEVLVLLAGVEVESVAAPILGALAGEGETTAFFTSADAGAVFTRAAPAAAGSGMGEAGLTREDFVRLASAAPAAGATANVFTRHGHTFLTAAARFDAAGSSWIVGTVRPWRFSLGDANRFFLLAGLAALVFLAGAIGVVAAVRRLEAQRAEEKDQVSRWRQAAAAAQREAWRRALLATPGFAVVELQGTRIVEANGWAVRYLAAESPAALVGRDVLTLVVERDREPLARLLTQEAPSWSEDVAVPVSFLVQGDSRRSAHVRRLQVSEPTQSTVFLTWQDTTGKERGEALARALSALMHAPVVFVNPSGVVVWSNEAFDETARRLGIKVSTTSAMKAFRPEERRLLEVMFVAALRGESSEKLLPLAAGRGGELAVVLRAAPVVAAGEVFGVLFAAQEVRGAPPGAVSLSSDRRAEALAQLAATLSHRLTNDLQALQGRMAAARLASGSAVEGIATHLHAAVRELQRFVSVCSRSGKALRLARLSVLLEGWVAEKAKQMPAGVRLALSTEATEDRVIVDTQQIESFLEYALAATVRVLERMGGSVQVAVERGETPGTVRMSVRDTGSEPVDSDSGERVGLPEAMARETVLAVAQLVAERHGGAAGWRQPAGIGSHVWVDLPLRPGAVPESPRRRRERRRGLVLVADDEELVRTSLAEALREAGFAVEEASNGAEVLDKVLATPAQYALIVLDLVMPIVDGRETLHRLAREAPNVPVLLCTGYELGAGELAGAEVMVKPFSLQAFVERVRNLTEGLPHNGDRMNG